MGNPSPSPLTRRRLRRGRAPALEPAFSAGDTARDIDSVADVLPPPSPRDGTPAVVIISADRADQLPKPRSTFWRLEHVAPRAIPGN